MTLNQTDWSYWGTNIALAFALSLDSCFINAANATSLKKKRLLLLVVFSFVFGFAHFFMLILGYYFGQLFLDFTKDFTKWISFGILGFLGIKELVEELMELHLENMKKRAMKLKFNANSYIVDLFHRGVCSKHLRKVLKKKGALLMAMDVTTMIEFGVRSTQDAKELGRYLYHESSYHAKESLTDLIQIKKEKKSSNARFVMSVLLLLLSQALATSLDAAAAGLTFTSYSPSLALLTFGMIGVVIILMSIVGGLFGKFLGEKYEKIASIGLGLVFIALGIKALF